MAKISLFEMMEESATIKFEFTTPTFIPTSKPGEKLAVLTLVDPIEFVRGSQMAEVDGKNYPVIAENVVEIKVHQDDFLEHEEDFIVDSETKLGTYVGKELVLDVAKKTGEVWLRATPFAQSAQSYSQTLNQERYKRYVPEGATGTPVAKTSGTPPVIVD